MVIRMMGLTTEETLRNGRVEARKGRKVRMGWSASAET